MTASARAETPIRRCLRAVVFFFVLPGLLAAAVTQLEILNQGQLEGWKTKRFKDETRYTAVLIDGKRVVHGVAKGSASGRYRELHVDLEKTPYLHWSWRVDKVIDNAYERSKRGDDFPVRVYVIFSGGLAFWKTHTINYVWANQAKSGEHWLNPFTANAQMFAARGLGDALGAFVEERRHVREDFKLLFGADIHYVDAVAIMTDADNTGGASEGYYGDIYFAAE